MPACPGSWGIRILLQPYMLRSSLAVFFTSFRTSDEMKALRTTSRKIYWPLRSRAHRAPTVRSGSLLFGVISVAAKSQARAMATILSGIVLTIFVCSRLKYMPPDGRIFQLPYNSRSFSTSGRALRLARYSGFAFSSTLLSLMDEAMNDTLFTASFPYLSSRALRSSFQMISPLMRTK